MLNACAYLELVRLCLLQRASVCMCVLLWCWWCPARDNNVIIIMPVTLLISHDKLWMFVQKIKCSFQVVNPDTIAFIGKFKNDHGRRCLCWRLSMCVCVLVCVNRHLLINLVFLSTGNDGRNWLRKCMWRRNENPQETSTLQPKAAHGCQSRWELLLLLVNGAHCLYFI